MIDNYAIYLKKNNFDYEENIVINIDKYKILNIPSKI